MIVNIIDFILTIIFWLPAKLIGYEKCSKCTIRIRRYQLMRLIVYPVAFIPKVKILRNTWRGKIDPPSILTEISLSEIH